MLFDIDAADAAKLEGMARAYENAPSGWNAEAFATIEQLARSKEEITSDDVWRVLWQPPEGRALGPIFRLAAMEGIIEKTGRTRNSARPVHHAFPMTIWRSLVYRGRNGEQKHAERSRTVKRFFLAHAKDDGDDRIELLLDLARVAITKAAHGEPFEIVTGRDHFEQRFKAAGSWDAWTAEVATGVHPITRVPLFHGFLVPARRIGAGTAKIIEFALRARKPCFVFSREGKVARVIAVQQIDPADWKTGHGLTVGQFS